MKYVQIQKYVFYCFMTSRMGPTRVKTHNLFTVDENRPDQCFAAHIVLGC